MAANAHGKLSLAIGPDADPIPITGAWRYRKAEYPDADPDHPEPPPDYYMPLDSSLYNGMVAPLIPFAIRGVIWYQGESNVERAHEYRDLFAAMISDWRQQWGEGDFPFYYAQLCNSANSVVDAVAELREAQSMAMKLANTGMAVTLDIGESGGHPRNKLDVGERLARWALAKDYGRAIEPSGPTFKSMNVEGSRIRLHFDHIGAGLVVHGRSLTEFTVAGTDRVFKQAAAEIDGDDVVVHSDDVVEPVATRYAWSNVVPQLSLYNRDGLPAPPFRTDDWPGATFGKTIPWWWKQ
jgi:sialate O-acetylesterase